MNQNTGLKIALGVSLVVNIFVVGAVGGAMYTRHQILQAAPAGPARGNPLMRAGEDFTAVHRVEFRQMLRNLAPQVRPTQQQARQARDEAADLFASPNYDPAKVSGALDRARTAEMASRKTLETAMTQFAVRLSPAERASLARHLRRPTPGGRKDGKGEAPPSPEAPPPPRP